MKVDGYSSSRWPVPASKERQRRRRPTNSPFRHPGIVSGQRTRKFRARTVRPDPIVCALPHCNSIRTSQDKTRTMGLDIKSVIQQKTRWVATKLSLRKLSLRSRKRSRKADTTELQPVALAGASRGFTGSSTQCNHFARTPSGAQHEQWTDSSGGGSSLSDGRWKTCRMCARKFSPLSMSRQYADYCSLDCKSAFMLGRGTMAKSTNPMEAYRREQKKKELKKLRHDRQKDKQAKLSSMDPSELQQQLKNLERQVSLNPTDGPTRKRKQELEDTLRAVVKKQKEMKDEEQKKQAGAPPPPLMTMKELTAANKEKFQNPENSIYYHPTLNPFGAPPPGKPQVYRDGTAIGVAAPRGPPQQGGYSDRPQQRGFRGPPPPRGQGFRGLPPPMPRGMARRLGKRPPLPSGPPPPGTIQVPMRPPLPTGALPMRPPPPPPVQAQVPPPPPPPYPIEDSSASVINVAAPYPELENGEVSVVAPYPPPNNFNQNDEEMDEEAAESRAQLRSLVPVALRVQRQAAPSSSVANIGSTPSVPAPRPIPAPPAPRPPVNIGPPPSTVESSDKNSVSNEFDAFMEEYQAAFARFLRRNYRPDLQLLHRRLRYVSTPLAARTETPEQSILAYSQRICAQRLLDFDAPLGTLLFRHPEQLLPLFHQALVKEVSCNAGEPLEGGGLPSIPLKARRKLKVRVENLPPVPPLRKEAISAIRSNDVKQFIQIAGTVVRTGMIKMQETEREYQCCNARCGHRFLVKSDPEQGNMLEIPKVCPSDSTGDTSSGGKKPCKSTQFMPVGGADGLVVSDHQVIKIQEQASKLGVGSIPRSILVVLEDDLVDSVKAGDQVVVAGILMRTWKPCVRGVRCDLETTINANSIRVKNASTSQVMVTEELRAEFAQFWAKHKQDPTRGRNEIVASICPKVYGLFMVKLAVALTVIGGVSYVDETGMKTRGEPHMLLIGDPGTGKSQFLRFTAELSPRSVLTTGIGTTSAGLTCTAVKDGGEWMLEAGALVLADRGVCCIDEFSSIRSNDRTSIHEAMEQQTLSVAKAGLVCKLNARTTIFAVTNPKGRYDPTADVSVNTSIASPLLSRFDLILVLLDRMNPRWDQVVSSFILKQAVGTSTSMKEEAKREGETSFDSVNTPRSKEDSTLWSIQKLQAYICHVKDRYQPQLTRAAMMILQRYYERQRASDSRSAARTTIRLLESLTRLAQAHARLMCHSEVAVMDAVVAVFVMEVSKSTDNCSDMLEGGVESVLHSNFSDDPQGEYALQEKLVLEYLLLQELSTTSSSQSQPSPSQPTTSSQQRPDSVPHATTEYEEEDHFAFAENQYMYHPAAEDRQVTTGKRSWSGSQPHNGQKQRREDPPSQQPEPFIPSSIPQHEIDDEDLDIMDDYRRGIQQSQHAEEQPRAPPKSRFNFGRWSQQAEASQSIISKWKK
ncbi:DNA helicase MCM9 [Phytophthora citrophthora]|uniref:Probable DNA helicase MCM9 n=1 Tax=Phytophthora citrophthora TaxID=4793 RepID=A0AAD9G865_9STRA|nr:DNA helicase MCM9 [Phytophthora citrophthora]